MIITNSTSKKLRFAIWRDVSEDKQEEVFAYIIQKGCSLNIPNEESLVVTEEDERHGIDQ